MAKKKPPFCDFSGLPTDQCAHCKEDRPRCLAPTYELKRGRFGRYPIGEILKNGGRVHPYDKHFIIGTRKACLLLDAISMIEQFVATTDEDGIMHIPSHMLNIGDDSTSFKTWIEMHQEFIRSDGVRIVRPWLHTRSLPPGPEIGIGVQKAKAISALQTELKKWVFDVA